MRTEEEEHEIRVRKPSDKDYAPPTSETGRSHEGHMKITCFKQGYLIIATAFLRHRDCIIFS